MGRKNKYIELVEPRLAEVEEWIANDVPDETIAKNLGVSLRSLYEYREKYPQFSHCYMRARATIVRNVKSALLKKALGYEYEETKTIARGTKSDMDIISMETYKRHCPPSETAAAMLLRNYDKDWQDVDNVTAKLRKQAQSLKEAIAAANNFDLKISEDN